MKERVYTQTWALRTVRVLAIVWLRETMRERRLDRMRMRLVRVQVCVLALRWMLRWVWKRVRVKMRLLGRRRMRMSAKVEVLMWVRVWV